MGIGDTTSDTHSSDLDIAKQQYRPPTSWSTGTGIKNNQGNNNHQSTVNGDFNANQQNRPFNKEKGNSFGNNRPNGRPTGNFNSNGNVNRNTEIEENHNHQEFEGNNGFKNNNGFQTSSTGSENDNLTGAASHDAQPTFQPTPADVHENINTNPSKITPPSRDLSPPLPPTTTEASEEFDLDIRMKNSGENSVYNFIKRFDPNAPDSHKTAMTPSEILTLNSHLPLGHDVSAEDDRTPRRNKNVGNNFNTLHDQRKGVTEATRFNSINQKTPNINDNEDETVNVKSVVKVPERILLPPKTENSELPSTTMGPPIYYEWKWAVPAFDLEPPKQSNETRNGSISARSADVKSPFRDVTTTTPKAVKINQPNTEYNTSSYFIPDYLFPLDKEHPGYENDDAQTSFQV